MVPKRNWLLILITLIVFSGFLVNYLDRVPKRHYCDFRVYYKAGQDLIKGKNIYIREKEEITPYKYSPFFAFAFAGLSLLPIKASASVFFAINFLLTCFFFKLSFNLAQSSGILASFSSRDRVLIYGLTCLCSLRYIFLVWDEGQVSILMGVLVLTALSFLSKEKGALAGAFFAAAILIKYTPAIFLPYLLFQKKYKAVFWTMAFAGLFLLLPALIVGLQTAVLYISSWIPHIIATSLDRLSLTDIKNQSIYSMLLRFFITTQYSVHRTFISFDQILLLGKIVALLMYLAVFIPGRYKPRDMVINSAILMICISLFNPNAWMLNFVSLIPAYMLLIQYSMAKKGKDRFVLFCLVSSFILINMMSRDILGKWWEYFGCTCSFTTLGALIVYTALLKLKFSRTANVSC